MSFWAKITDIEITNIKAFEKACTELNLKFEKHEQNFKGTDVSYKITDGANTGMYSNCAYLYKKNNNYLLLGDTDSAYNSLAKKYGKNFGLLKQAYLKQDILYRAKKRGSVVHASLSTDGSIIIRIGS